MTNSSLPKATPEQLREELYNTYTHATLGHYDNAWEAVDDMMEHFATFLASIELPEKNNREQIKCPEWCGLCVQNGRRYNDEQSQAIIDKIVEELK